MLGYRLYILNDAGHIVDAVEAVLETDPEAIEWAKLLLDGKDRELWTGARPVAKFPRASSPKVSP